MLWELLVNLRCNKYIGHLIDNVGNVKWIDEQPYITKQDSWQTTIKSAISSPTRTLRSYVIAPYPDSSTGE